MISVFILLLTLSLRVWGIQFGLPDLFHADEPIVVNHALYFGTGDFNPHFFNIPPLASYLLFTVYGLLFLTGKILGQWVSSQQFADFFFEDPSSLYLVGRMALGVLPSVLSVWCLMAWIKKEGFFSVWRYIGGALFAVCFVHVSDAHYIYTDMLLVLAGLLFFLHLSVSDFREKRFHWMAGMFIGLATAIKYNGFFLVIPYVWILIRARAPLKVFLQHAVFSAAAAAVIFVVLNPYSMLDYHFFIQELNEQSAANQGVPFFHHAVYSLAEGMSWPLVIMGCVGLIRAFFASDMKREAVALFCLTYYFVLWQKGQPYGRYILPLVPFLIYLAVDAASFLIAQMRYIRPIIYVLIIAAFILNVTKSVRFDLIMSRPDIRTLAKEWIEKNIPSGSRIALDGTSFTPRLSFSCEQLEAKRSELAKANSSFESVNDQRVQAKLRQCHSKPGYSLFFIADKPGANPFLFASNEIKSDFSALAAQAIQYVVVVFDEKLRNELQQKGRLVMSWSPYEDSSVGLWKYDPQIITGGPFTWNDLLARRSNGYRIELYALDGAVL